jgi:hypothetical protein
LLATAAGRNCHILSVDGHNIFFTCPEEELAWRDVATSINPLVLLKSAVCSESALCGQREPKPVKKNKAPSEQKLTKKTNRKTNHFTFFHLLSMFASTTSHPPI